MRINIKNVDIREKEEYNGDEKKVEPEMVPWDRKRGTGMIDWIIGIVIAAAVAAVIIKKVKDAKAGKSGCGCGCSGCASKGKCH